MSRQKELRELADRIYDLAKREVWLGGVVTDAWDFKNRGTGHVGDWPKKLQRMDWSRGVHWTLSPEVKLGGHRLRVCVTSASYGKHTVRVFVDDELKYPGGTFRNKETDSFWTWLWKSLGGRGEDHWTFVLAHQELEEGGKTGPVFRRDLLIEEANDRLKSVTVKAQIEEDPAYKAALEEVNRIGSVDKEKQL